MGTEEPIKTIVVAWWKGGIITTPQEEAAFRICFSIICLRRNTERSSEYKSLRQCAPR